MRDMKMAYGLDYDTTFLTSFINLRTFIIELNDLRGSDRQTFPKIIADITHSLSHLRNLECVELTQKPASCSCTFDDTDVEPEGSEGFLKSLDTLMKQNRELKKINIFYPLLMKDLE